MFSEKGGYASLEPDLLTYEVHTECRLKGKYLTYVFLKIGATTRTLLCRGHDLYNKILDWSTVDMNFQKPPPTASLLKYFIYSCLGKMSPNIYH